MKSNSIDLEFDSEGFSYTANLTEVNQNTLTIVIAFGLLSGDRELELRRRIGKIDKEMGYGALIYDEERQVVLWRESINSYEECPLEPNDITDLISVGITSFEALRIGLADFMGLSPADAHLANVHSAGRA
ncbi:MAG: hypothetical protein ACK4SL_01140 [Candidatus Paceibacteria bacterium]